MEQLTERTTPSLPLEVWFNILEYVTPVPNAFDTRAPDAFAYPAPLSQDQIQKSIRASLCTQRRIVLVCKAWNSYGTRLLYQAIPITSMKVTEGSMDLGRRISRCDGSQDLCDWESRARSIIRLDIVLLRRRASLQADAIIELFCRLPNLQIVVFRGTSQAFVTDKSDCVSLFDLFEMQVIPTLTVLDVRFVDCPDKIDGLDVITGFP